MLDRNLNAITLDDIDRLVNDRVTEGLHLDYKADVNLGTEDGKSELLDDLVAFANSAGGDLIIGVGEETNSEGKRTEFPAKPTGIVIENTDKFKLRIEDLLRDSVEPRLVGVAYQFLQMHDGKFIAIIRIPKSFAFHLIRKGKNFRCTARNHVGKYQLDAAQIREGFLSGETSLQRMRLFRQERIARIVAGEAPIKVEDIGKIVLHMLPLQGFLGTKESISDFGRSQRLLKGPFSTLANDIHNLDGRLSYSRGCEQGVIAYCQAFRNGALESVETGLGGVSKDQGVLYFNAQIDGYIVNGVHRLLQYLKAIGVSEPIYVGISIVGAKGYRIIQPHTFGQNALDREVVVLPETELTSSDLNHQQLAHELQPTTDILYQAFGFEHSFNYAQSGNYLHDLGQDYVQDRR